MTRFNLMLLVLKGEEDEKSWWPLEAEKGS